LHEQLKFEALIPKLMQDGYLMKRREKEKTKKKRKRSPIRAGN
jgi:hypothetical protein